MIVWHSWYLTTSLIGAFGYQSHWLRNAYRTNVHSTIGFSAFELVHGVNPRTPVVSEFDNERALCRQPYDEYLSRLNKQLRHSKQVKLSIERCQASAGR